MENKLDEKIDELEIDELSEYEIERVVSSYSKEGMTLRRKRKSIRYELYRLRTEATGGPATNASVRFRERFENDSAFGGWKFFAITWDVATDNPNRCVHRDLSETKEWDELVAAKFPQIEPGGKINYPDINVRKKIEANAKKQKKKKKS